MNQMSDVNQDDRRGLPSASNWRRYELCAGSFQLECEARRLGQEAHKKSEAAASGERIHARLAGQSVELGETEATTAAFLAERAEEQVIRIFGSKDVPHIAEKRLWLDYDGKKALSGRFDVCYFTEKVALVIDFKAGWREVDAAEQNAQLKVLAVLVGIALPSVEEIVVQIISGPYGVTQANYNLEALSQAYREIIATLRAINDPNAGFNPSIAACTYCNANLICAATKALVKPLARTQMSALPDGDRAAKLLDECELLERHIDAIREYYAERLTADASYELPGYAMVPNAPRREIADVDAARRKLGEFLDEGELNTAMDLKVGQVEKLFGKKVGLKGKELREKFNSIMHGVLIEKEPKPSLKRVAGKPKLVELNLP